MKFHSLGVNKYDLLREAEVYFNSQHPMENIYHETVRKVLNKFKSSRDVSNKVSNKRKVDIMFDVMLSATEHPKYSLRERAPLKPNTSHNSVIRED